jgi:four helix bundle protein
MVMLLEELQVYRMAMGIGERIWTIVVGWDYFAKDTIGKQLVRAADSIAANLSEGHGRYFYKENRQFCYYSRGSLQETKTWLRKAANRKLVEKADFQTLSDELDTLSVKLNNYIKSIGKKAPQTTLDGRSAAP